MSICVSCEGLHCLLVYIQMNVNLCFMRGLALYSNYFQIDVNLCFMRELALFASLHSNGRQSMFHARGLHCSAHEI